MNRLFALRWAAIACLFAATPLFSQTKDDVYLFPDGESYRIETDANGSPQWIPTEFRVVIWPGAGPVPPNPPTDPGDPDPPTNPTGIERIKGKVQALAVQIGEPDTAAALGVFYSEIADRMARKELDVSDARTILDIGFVMVVRDADGTAAKWKPVKDAIDAEITALRQEGEISDDSDWWAAFEFVSAGFTSAGGDEQQVARKFDFDRILKMILAIIEIIKVFKGL